jgi:hypothetical protein
LAIAARYSPGLPPAWRIDQLDKEAAVLHRLDRARDLDQLAGGGFGST